MILPSVFHSNDKPGTPVLILICKCGGKPELAIVDINVGSTLLNVKKYTPQSVWHVRRAPARTSASQVESKPL